MPEIQTNIKNPREIAYVVRNKTFCMTSYLQKFDVTQDDYPLMLYKWSNLSRYEVALITEGKSVTANIPLMEILYILRKSDHLFGKHFDAEMVQGDDTVSPAYTVKLTSGNMKGKTPAQILLEAEDKEQAKQLLNSQYKFLKDNLSRYPRNKIQMDAITEASVLYNQQQLSASKAKSGGQNVVLYEAELRTRESKPVPERLKQKNPNFRSVYDIKIEWALGTENPITVTIVNYFAPVLKLEDGRWNVIRKDADPETMQKQSMALSAKEWNQIVHLIRMDIDRFEMLNAKESFTVAEQLRSQLWREYQDSIRQAA